MGRTDVELRAMTGLLKSGCWPDKSACQATPEDDESTPPDWFEKREKSGFIGFVKPVAWR